MDSLLQSSPLSAAIGTTTALSALVLSTMAVGLEGVEGIPFVFPPCLVEVVVVPPPALRAGM